MTKIVSKFTFLWVVVFVFAFSPTAVQGEVAVITVDGTKISGELLGWDADGIVVYVSGNQKLIPLDQLLTVVWSTEKDAVVSGASIELTDSSVLPISSYRVDNSVAEISTPLLKNELKISTSVIHRVQFSTLKNQLIEIWNTLEEKQFAQDTLVVNKKNGTVLDYLNGLLGDITSDQVNFTWEDDEIPVKWSKVAALAYYHAQQPEFNAAVCSLKTLNGAHLPVARVEFEGDDLKVTTIGGLDFRLSQEILHTADFSQGKISYLSDLQPRKQVWTPHIALPSDADHIQDYGQPRKDQSFAGSALTLEWSAVTGAPENKSSVSEEIHTYNKGLAIRSRTELVYRLPPQMQRFFAIAGINPSTSKQGNVTLEIYANKQLVWQGEIDGNSEPSEIDVAIDGARELRILVDYGSNLDYGDQLHLVEAKVTK